MNIIEYRNASLGLYLLDDLLVRRLGFRGDHELAAARFYPRLRGVLRPPGLALSNHC